ncbi:hypothetical protein AGMMS50218_11350 [Actinomycetota bacterium]|nr:hypothetical protein AGMMS50218_11350 [Actinomycetota bacterium]
MPVLATPTSGAGRDGGPGIADRAARLQAEVDLSAVRGLTVVVDAGDGPAAEVLAAVLDAAVALRVVPLGRPDATRATPLTVATDATAETPWTGATPLTGATDSAAETPWTGATDATGETNVPQETPSTGAAHTAEAAHPSGAQRDPDARRALRAAVIDQHADLGLAVDDAGGCLVVDESGTAVRAGVVAVLVGLRVVARERTAGRTPTVVHDLLLSRAVPDLLATAGAVTVGIRTDARPGDPSTVLHTETTVHDGVLGVGLGARFAFRGIPAPDAGLLAALHVLAAVGGQPHPLSLLAELYQPYATSGHLIRSVPDVAAAIERVQQAYVVGRGAGPVQASGGTGPEGLLVSHWDSHPQWWFHLGAARPDLAEPSGPSGSSGPSGLVGLRVEAADEDIMDKVRDDVLALVQDPA